MQNDLNYYESIGIDTKKKSFKRYYNAGLLNHVDEDYLKEIEEYWQENYNRKISPLLHIAFHNLTGKKDVRIVPSKPELWNEFIPFFNDMNIRVGYSDKNIYDKLINTDRKVEHVLKRVRGHYYDASNNLIDSSSVYSILSNINEDLIVKPSNADNGIGVTKLRYSNNQHYLKGKKLTLDNLEEKFEYNFIVQKVVNQHEIMARPHKESLNTLRIVTLRWNNKIHHLLTYARIGANGDERDNSEGRVVVGVDDDGSFYDFAINSNLETFKEHPSTGFDFSKMGSIPNYENYINFVKELHKDVLHHDLVSWDIIVGQDEQPIFLEMNFRGPTWIYQLASQKPMFGELTEEILPFVSKELNHNQNRNSKSDFSKLQVKHNKLKKEHKKLKSQEKKLRDSAKKLENELDEVNVKYTKLLKEHKSLLNRKSWKLTSPIRKVYQKLRK